MEMQRRLWLRVVASTGVRGQALQPQNTSVPVTQTCLSWFSTAAPSHVQWKKKQRLPVSPSARRLRSVAPRSRSQKPLRIADKHVASLTNERATSSDFVRICNALQAQDEITLLAKTDLQAWNLALQHRLLKDDTAGAKALLSLLGNFQRANTNVQLWTDLLFTLLWQPSSMNNPDEVTHVLEMLQTQYGQEFVGKLLVSVINGCANIKMFEQAQFLVRYHLALADDIPPIPPRVLGNLVSTMAKKRRYADVIAFTKELFAHDRLPLHQLQQPVFIALFASCNAKKVDPTDAIDIFLSWVQEKYHQLLLEHDGNDNEEQKLEKVFGAAIQCGVHAGKYKAVLRCYDAMVQHMDDTSLSSKSTNKIVISPDENIYVNVMKACLAEQDIALFKDVYMSMVRDGVGRSAGFGSAIRYCHVHGDAVFLDQVLDDAFAEEDAAQGMWMLDVPQYNDALGCFAETKSFESARELFSRMVNNPFIVPDHITMVEIVENYRDAPFAEIFGLMELFLEWQLTPNLQVFTSLLATCARRRLIGDAVALLSAMRARGVVPDVKTYTVIAFIYSSHGDLPGIIQILKDMTADNVITDAKFFDCVINALYDASGIDMCFALFREMHHAQLTIPEGMYVALIDLGTRIGLVARTLAIAYNMECDGFALSSEQLLALIRRCEASAEVAELIRTFLLLHQGHVDPDMPPRFTRNVYEELIDVLVRFSHKDAIPKVKQLAQEVGYQNVE